VRQERWYEVAYQPRPGRLRDVDEREPLRFRAERDPDSATVLVDRDVPGGSADLDTAGDGSAPKVDGDDLTAAGVADEGVPAVRGCGRVARLAERAEHAYDLERAPVQQAYRPLGGMGDDRDGAADALDAPRAGQGRDRPAHASRAEVEGDDPSLAVRGHER
jgi:hypothetical protein